MTSESLGLSPVGQLHIIVCIIAGVAGMAVCVWGLAGEITATIQEEALLYQEAPVERVTGFDVPYPLYQLEDDYLPDSEQVADAIRRTDAFPN